MDRSRFLLGISKGIKANFFFALKMIIKKIVNNKYIYLGEEVMEEFMKLILKCGNNDDEATIKLLQWKNQRIPFWKYTTGNCS